MFQAEPVDKGNLIKCIFKIFRNKHRIISLLKLKHRKTISAITQERVYNNYTI